jgi:hypothetical protein
MVGSRWARLGPLTGLAFFVLVVVAFIGLWRNTPDIGDSTAKVVSFYKAHSDREQAGAFVLGIAGAFLVFFAAHLRSALRVAQPLSARLPNAAFGGGIVAATGFLAAAAVHLALAESAKKAHVSAQAVQALNVLDNDDFLLLAAGIAVMMLASGLALVRGAALLPRWLGWVAIVLGIVSFSPAGFFAFSLSGIWVATVSVLLFLRWSTVQKAEADRHATGVTTPGVAAPRT